MWGNITLTREIRKLGVLCCVMKYIFDLDTSLPAITHTQPLLVGYKLILIGLNYDRIPNIMSFTNLTTKLWN